MKARNENMDIARSLGIILVVVGHIIQMNCGDFSNNMVFQVIYSFHMPLFFFISGYVTYKTDWNPKYDWILKKFVSLVIPYLVWFVIKYSLNGYIIENGILSAFKLLATKYDIGYWFLLSLFLCDCALFLAVRLSRLCVRIDSLRVQVVCCLVVLCLFWILQHFENYLGTSSVWAYFPYVICGYTIAGTVHKELVSVNKIMILVGGFITGITFFALCIVKFADHNMLLFESIMRSTGVKQFASEIDDKFLALMAIDGVFCFSFILKNTSLCKILTYLGKHTVEIYVIHFSLLRTYVDNIYINCMISFFVALLLPLGIEIVLRRAIFVHKLLFGR